MQQFELRRFNRCYTTDDPAKSNLNAGVVVQKDPKMDFKAPVKPTSTKAYTPVKRAEQQ